VRAVDGRENILGAGKGAKLARGKDDAGDGGDVTEENHAGAGRDGVAEAIENVGGVGHGLGQGDFFHDDAVALGSEIPGMFAAGVFLVGDENFVAGFEVDAVGDVAVGLGGVADEGEFFAGAADEGGERVAEFVPGRVAPNGVVLGIALGHFFGVVVGIENGAENGSGGRADGAVVEIDFILRNEELLAKSGPVGFFVRIVESAVGECGSLLKKARPKRTKTGRAHRGGKARK
jgi:hypothetical protein